MAFSLSSFFEAVTSVLASVISQLSVNYKRARTDLFSMLFISSPRFTAWLWVALCNCLLNERRKGHFLIPLTCLKHTSSNSPCSILGYYSIFSASIISGLFLHILKLTLTLTASEDPIFTFQLWILTPTDIFLYCSAQTA